MNKKKIKFWVLTTFITLILASGSITAYASSSQSVVLPPLQSGGDVISAINGYRAAYGLPQLSTNAILTSTAQAQANYQASIQTVTHTGPGGSTARDRAISAGYNPLYLSEIIYGGWDATTNTALTWWQNSTVHNNVMLSSNYTEIGAGVAVSGDSVYFTAVLASPSGSPLPTQSSPISTNSNDDSVTAPVAVPVQKATPQADGSIIHIVQEGQTLWTIEAVYGLESGTLRELNELPSYPYVFPGDELIIRTAGSYALEETPGSISETEEPDSATKGNTKTVLGTPFSYVDPAKVTPTAPIVITKPVRTTTVPTNASSKGLLQGNSTAKTLVIAALIILIIVLIGSMFLQKPPDKPVDN